MFALFIPALFTYQITAADKRFFTNCKYLRDYIKGIINERKKGNKGGLAVGDNLDMISMLLQDDNYKNNIEDIVDDVIVMFIAGTKTVQGTTTNFIGQYVNNEELR